MQPRPRLTDRDRTDPRATNQRRTEQDARIAADDDVPAVRWSDLRPEIGARGAIITVFMSSLVGDLAAQYLHATRLAGFGFMIGCVAAASLTRRRFLLIVTTTPPLIFLVAVTCAEALAAHAGHVDLSAGRIAAGVFLTLASTAPWLFGGFAAALVIATGRGLVRCVADLRCELGASPNREPASRASRPTSGGCRPAAPGRAQASQCPERASRVVEPGNQRRGATRHGPGTARDDLRGNPEGPQRRGH